MLYEMIVAICSKSNIRLILKCKVQILEIFNNFQAIFLNFNLYYETNLVEYIIYISIGGL